MESGSKGFLVNIFFLKINPKMDLIQIGPKPNIAHNHIKKPPFPEGCIY